MPQFDAIVVGTGQAGPSLARRLVAAGRKVAVIERKHFGGTCVNTGCTPTKALVASAYAAHVARRHADYGVTIGGPIGVDMKAVRRARTRSSRRRATAWSARSNHSTAARSIRATGASCRATEVQVGETVLSAPQIFINVGGRASVPPMPGLDQVPYLTNSSMVDFDFLPEHLIVVGGSYIGLEFAQAYRRFGISVTVIEMAPRLIAREDEDVSMGVADVLEAEGIDAAAERDVPVGREASGRRRGERRLHRRRAASRRLASAARGRAPAEHRRSRARQRPASRPTRAASSRWTTSCAPMCDGIFALGDCNGRGAFTHTSYNDFEIVAANLLDGEAAPRRPTGSWRTRSTPIRRSAAAA